MNLALRQPEKTIWNELFNDTFFAPFVSSQAEKEQSFLPAIDISENKNNLILRADLPGVEEKDIKLEYKKGILNLVGERKHEKQEEANEYYRHERVFGKFSRSFKVGRIDADKIKAKFKNGILEIKIPKKEEEKPKQIAIS